METSINSSRTDVMKYMEEVTDRAVNAQVEKNLFLGEYKERIIKALTFDEIREKGIYYEIEKALENKEVAKMAISIYFFISSKFACLEITIFATSLFSKAFSIS